MFKKDTVDVTNKDGLLILVGQKPVRRNIYTVPLPLGQPPPVPPTVPQTLQLITPVTVPKNGGVMPDTRPDTRTGTRPGTRPQIPRSQSTNALSLYVRRGHSDAQPIPTATVTPSA